VKKAQGRRDLLREKTNGPIFTIEEIGLTNRQGWATTLGALARRGAIGRSELEIWLRPAALTGLCKTRCRATGGVTTVTAQLAAPLGHTDGAYHRRCLHTIVAGMAPSCPKRCAGRS
jgi:hypothetical protein